MKLKIVKCTVCYTSTLMPCYVTIQEAERKQAEASSEELMRRLEELKLAQERNTQVSATAHICIGSAYDTPLENGTDNSEVYCLLCQYFHNSMPCYVTIQEVKEKLKTERLLDLEWKQLQRKREDLKKQLWERDAQVRR